MTLLPTILLLLGLATTLIIAVRKADLGGGLAMFGISLRSLVDPVDAAVLEAARSLAP